LELKCRLWRRENTITWVRRTLSHLWL
jgi:hypothetical protein